MLPHQRKRRSGRSVPGRHPRARAGAVVLLAGWWWCGPLAVPVAADPPRPTDYQATITDVSPSTAAIDVEVIGGDSLLRLQVERGHEAVVSGYDGEPYLRFGRDGVVSENTNSATTYANGDRYANTEAPDDLDPEGPPTWRSVARDGSYAWHDHRIHWMSSQPPAGIPRGSEVQRWTVPLVVDQQPVTVSGVLRYEPAIAWWPWVVAIVGVAGLLVVLGRWARPLPVATVASGVACALALIVATREQLAIPGEAGRSLVPIVVPAVGLLGALAAGFLGRWRVGAIAAAAAAAGGWALLRLAVFTKPVLPTDLAPSLDRAGTATALGLVIAAAVLLAIPQDRRLRPGAVGPDPVGAGTLGTTVFVDER